MPKNQEPIEAPKASAAASPIKPLVDDFGYTTKETRRFLPVGKTKFFTEILPQLDSYLEGTRRIIIGRSIRAYRERKLAEPRQKRPSPPPPLGNPKARNEKRRSRRKSAAP
jgi:hypothetical protein